MSRINAAVAGALVLALAACGERGGTGTTGKTAGGANETGTREAGAPRDQNGVAVEGSAARDGKALSAEDRRFVQEAASAGLYEVQSSQIARQKGLSATHEQFAERMIADHGRANDELEEIAQRKGVEVPTTLMPKHQEQIDELRELSGSALETSYHEQQMAAHDESIRLFEDASKNLTDPDLKAFATKTLPTLRQHKQMMQDEHGASPR